MCIEDNRGKEIEGQRGKKDGFLCTCAIATDGTGHNGFMAAAITVGVYVLACEVVCTRNEARGASGSV